VSFIARPTEVFRAYLKSTGRIDELGFQLGRMSMALEIITQIKALEELRAIASDLGRAEAVSALDTLLHEHVPAGIAAVVDADGPRLLGTIHEISSGPASPEVETAPDSTPPAEPEERHGQELDGPSSFLPGGVPWREE
jgi:hypothetical protein